MEAAPWEERAPREVVEMVYANARGYATDDQRKALTAWVSRTVAAASDADVKRLLYDIEKPHRRQTKEPLTEFETIVLAFGAYGYNIPETARANLVSLSYIEKVRMTAFAKLGARNMANAIMLWLTRED